MSLRYKFLIKFNALIKFNVFPLQPYKDDELKRQK